MMRKFTEVAALVIAGSIAATPIAPLGLASPPAPVPARPDARVKRVTTSTNWPMTLSVAQVSVLRWWSLGCGLLSRLESGNMGTSCARSEMDSVMASLTHGLTRHLVPVLIAAYGCCTDRRQGPTGFRQ